MQLFQLTTKTLTNMKDLDLLFSQIMELSKESVKVSEELLKDNDIDTHKLTAESAKRSAYFQIQNLIFDLKRPKS